MTTFSKKEIDELVRLHREELGLEVSEEKACQNAEQFLNLLIATYRDAPDLANNSPP